MKRVIHPKWYPEAEVSCICGNSFTVGSTKPKLSVNTCNKCHPFFTGEQKFVDTEGRVEKFQKKQKEAEVRKKLLLEKKKKKEIREREAPKTLREMLLGYKQNG